MTLEEDHEQVDWSKVPTTVTTGEAVYRDAPEEVVQGIIHRATAAQPPRLSWWRRWIARLRSATSLKR